MNGPAQLIVSMYHYVRDLPRTRFPEIKGMLRDDFTAQVNELRADFEMATLDSALDFLNGRYQPRRNLCLMTFDDGLREHYTAVTPILAKHKIQGLFFPITDCLQNHRVVSVHMNHFLMASLGFTQYRKLFMDELRGEGVEEDCAQSIDSAVYERTYPRDTSDVARFKYLFNFNLEWGLRDRLVKRLFERWIAPEHEFSKELYLNWPEAREMQDAGMVMGGHSHAHLPLAKLSAVELDSDLENCRNLIVTHLRPQTLWPFCYPYGKNDSFNHNVSSTLRRLGFCCSLATEQGANEPGANLFAIRRFDCKDIMSAVNGQRSEALLAKSPQVA